MNKKNREDEFDDIYWNQNELAMKQFIKKEKEKAMMETIRLFMKAMSMEENTELFRDNVKKLLNEQNHEVW
jgi:CHASE3 domain sensor protein